MQFEGKVATVTGVVEDERIERVIAATAKNLGLTREQFVSNTGSRSTLGRIVKPEEVADLGVYLASEKSSGINGQTINVDAGATFN